MSNSDLEKANKLNKALNVLLGKLEEIKSFQYVNRINNFKITSVTINANTDNFKSKCNITLPIEYFNIDLEDIKKQIGKDINLIEEAIRKI